MSSSGKKLVRMWDLVLGEVYRTPYNFDVGVFLGSKSVNCSPEIRRTFWLRASRAYCPVTYVMSLSEDEFLILE